MFKELFWIKIWYTIATHMGFKIAALGIKLRGFWLNCVAPAPLEASNFKRPYLSSPNFDLHVLGLH